eukprot:3714-Heterococcus_DN1.PRE.1
MVPFQNMKLNRKNCRLCAHNEIGSVLLQAASLHLLRVDCQSPVRMLAVRPPLVQVCFRQQASMRTTGQRCSCSCGKSRLEVVSMKC